VKSLLTFVKTNERLRNRLAHQQNDRQLLQHPHLYHHKCCLKDVVICEDKVQDSDVQTGLKRALDYEPGVCSRESQFWSAPCSSWIVISETFIMQMCDAAPSCT